MSTTHCNKALEHLDIAKDDCETGRAAFALPQIKEAIFHVRQLSKLHDGLVAALTELRQHIAFDSEGDLTRAEFNAMFDRAGDALAKAGAA